MGNAPLNNLPGVDVVLNDLGLKLSPPDEGQKITILGICSDSRLPIREPLRVVNSEAAVDALFFADHDSVFTGASGQKWPSDLSMAVEEAFNAGATNVDVMVTAHRTGYATTGDSFETKYNLLGHAYEALLNSPVDLIVPVGVYFDDPEDLAPGVAGFTGKNFGKQLADFCYQATKEANSAHGIIEMMPPLRLASMINYRDTVTGNNGDTGSFWSYSGRWSTQDWRFDSPPTSTIAEWVGFLNTDSNALYLTGVHSNFVGSFSGTYYVNSKLESFLKGSELNTGTNDTVDGNYLLDWQALESDGSKAIDGKGNKIDAGSYISVVAAPIRSFNSQARRLAGYLGRNIAGNFVSTGGAAAYAGLITTLVPHEATTNKVIPTIGPAKQLGRSQADKLVGRRFVTFLIRSGGFVVAKGITGARNAGKYARSDYIFLSTVRIVQSCVDVVREVSEKYIGNAATPQTRSAMDQEIRSRLDSFKERGAILDFEFSITATPEQNVTGEVDVNLTVVPATELVKVNLTLSLNKTLS